MRKKISFLMGIIVCMCGVVANAADFQVKKASNVKKQETSGLESITSGSLLPGVIGLVSNVSALTKQQKELAAECVPTATEINWVNNMVKEYAKAGAVTADSMFKTVISGQPCDPNDTYAENLKVVATTNSIEPCTEFFGQSGEADKGMIWEGYPKASYGYYCADGMPTCASSKQKYKSNIYKVFGAIDFTVVDYTNDEAAMYGKMMEKMEKCSPENISKRNREAYASFLTTTISNAGQTTNTGSIMQAVGGLTSGGGLSGIGSLAPTVTQFLDK